MYTLASYRFPITEEMLEPILRILVKNLIVIFPILVGILGLILCVRSIPPLIAHILHP